MPNDLSVILQRIQAGERLEVKKLLEELPVWKGLKLRAEQNNHRQDGRSQQDKLLKSLQQRVLNIMRAYAAMHTTLDPRAAELQAVSQQLFWYMAETETAILTERKRSSIPGAVQLETNVLFNQEDLKVERQQFNLNRAGSTFLEDGSSSYFPTSKGPKSWKFRPSYKGKGFKGFSSSSSSWWGAKGRKGKGFGKNPVKAYGRHHSSTYGRSAFSWFKGTTSVLGTKLESHSIASKIAALPVLVDSKCTSVSGGINHPRSDSRFASPFMPQYMPSR